MCSASLVDNPFSVKSCFMLPIHLRFGLLSITALTHPSLSLNCSWCQDGNYICCSNQTKVLQIIIVPNLHHDNKIDDNVIVGHTLV